MSEQHPVRAAIAAERERIAERERELAERMTSLQEEIASIDEELAEVDRQFEGLDAADEAILRTIVQDEAKDSGRPEQSSPPPRPAAPSAPAPPPATREAPAKFGEGRSDPPAGRAAQQAARQEAALKVLRESEHGLSSSEVGRRSELSESQAKTALLHLETQGKATREGKGRWTRWSIAQETRTPVTEGPGERKHGSEDAARSGSLEGRIIQACMLEPKTMESLAGSFGDVEYKEVQAAIGKLIREGELRSRHKNGKAVYAFVG